MNIRFVRVSEDNLKLGEKLTLKKEQEHNIESIFESYAESLKFNYWQVYYIYDNDLLIGYLMYGKFQKQIWLDRFMISSNYQHHNYGKSIMPLIIERLKREYNTNQIYLSVYDTNKLAIDFYKKLGFRFTGNLDVNGELEMVLEI